MADARDFLRIWVIAVACLAVLVAVINLIVDPYEVFGTPRIAGISLFKPITRNHALLAKTFQVGREHPVTVLIGSSPVHIGIDADAPAWPAAMRPVYNFGIPGVYETSTGLRTLQESVAGGSVKNAVVFLDFQNFFSPENPDPELVQAANRFRTLPDGSANPERTASRANDMFLSLETMAALTDSVTTVVLQRRANVLDLKLNGSGSEADFIDAARGDGMAELFAQKDAFEVERAAKLVRIMAGWHGTLPDMDAVAAIIAFARAHDIRLTLVIAPHHVDAMEIYWRDGLWPRVEQLKAELTTLAWGNGVPLWDFLDYSAFNTEPVPPAGDRRTPTNWFWEPTHFKQQLGEVMIQRMFGRDGPPFGTLLTPDNLSAHNAQIRAERWRIVCDIKSVMLPASFGPDDCAPEGQPATLREGASPHAQSP